MADYWKSNERKFCDFCKCWMSDNKASIAFHESGKRHKLNVAKRITDISRSSEKAEQERKKMDLDMRKMEEAAMRAYTLDIHAGADLTARRVGAVINAGVSPGNATVGPTAAGTSRSFRQIDPIRLPGNSDDEEENPHEQKPNPETVPDASLWVEGKSDEGHTYYWNVKTNESVWTPPAEGFLTWAEYQRINELAVKQQEMHAVAEAKHFRENANEEVARYNRERLKAYRKPEAAAEKQAKIERQAAYRTEEDAKAPTMGAWQVVQPPPKPVDLELPKVDYYEAPVINVAPTTVEPPAKRFREKTIECLDPELAGNTTTNFKKRKFAAKGCVRKRLEDD